MNGQDQLREEITMTFTVDHFTRNIPVWETLIPYLANKNINCLELGSREGMSALWTLTNFKARSITCVDTWQNDTWRNNFISNTKGNDKITSVRNDATYECIYRQHLVKFYDFIYIDADHLATSVLTQAVLCWRMLKEGGILIFDDYGWTGGKQNGGKLPPRVGIDCFLATFIEEYELIHKGWQVIIKKK